MKIIALKIRAAARDADGVARLVVELETHGFKVRHQMPELSLITGDIDEAQVNLLRAMDGVEDVEPEPGYQLPPFEPDTPQ